MSQHADQFDGFDPARDFLVVTKQAADQLRQIADDPLLGEFKIRQCFVLALQSGSTIDCWTDNRGTIRTVEVLLRYSSRRLIVELVWGIHPDGSPKIAHDGMKSMVYVAQVVRSKAQTP